MDSRRRDDASPRLTGTREGAMDGRCPKEPPMNAPTPMPIVRPEPAPGGGTRADERHRRRVQLRPQPRRADPALGRRGRPADAVLHLRGRRGVPRPRRDLLHLSARHPGAARGALALSRAGLRAPGRSGALLRHRRRHACVADGGAHGRRDGRRSPGPDPGLAELRRRHHGGGRAAGERAARQGRARLAARPRPPRRRA